MPPTFDPATFTSPGLDHLERIARHLDAGPVPHALIDRLERSYEVVLADRLDGAAHDDPEREEALVGRALAAVAREVGRQDARWGALRDDPDDLPSTDDLHRGHAMEMELGGAGAGWRRAYGRGLAGGAAEAYARRHHRLEQLSALTEAETLRGHHDAVAIEDALDRLEARAAPPADDPDGFSIDRLRRERLTQAAEGLAAERLVEEVATLAREGGRERSFRTLVTEARERLRRRAAAADVLERRATRRAAWVPIRLSRLRRRLPDRRGREATPSR